MPTEKQVRTAHKLLTELIPDAHIKRVEMGPAGVVFDCSEKSEGKKSKNNDWDGKPFVAP